MIFKLFSKLKIEKNDLRFFFPLATVSGILMESFSWLPERINRDYFSAIIYDHLPWTTIGTIFVLQVLLALFHHSIRYEKTKNYTHDIIQHICIKIQHFCSPAFSVLMGLSLACTVMAAIKNSHHYLNHSIAFGYFSLFFLIIPWTSIYLEKSIDAQLSQPTTALLKVIGLTALAGVLIFPLLNQNPITVEFKLSLAEHYLVKKALSGEESVWEFAKKSTIKNASSHVHALELNDN